MRKSLMREDENDDQDNGEEGKKERSMMRKRKIQLREKEEYDDCEYAEDDRRHRRSIQAIDS
jgi:hypothetical protein